MTRTISLIIGIAVVALVAVPTALGEGPQPGTYPDANKPSIVTPDWNQPAIVSENTPESPSARADRLRGEALNKKYGLGEFAVEPQSVRAERLRSEGLNKMYRLGEFAPTVNSKDANERVDLPTTPESAPVATSGRDVEWPQVGIGFGIGIALAIVLGLSLKATRPRTLAH
jgi:hypothetical protein